MKTKLASIIIFCATLALAACNESSKSADPTPASNPNAGGTSTDTTPPTVSASVKTGTFSNPQAVVLTCTVAGGSGCKTIYYTTDGTAPTANSTAFSGSIAIGVGVTTLKYIAVDVAGNVSSIATETYTVSSGSSSDSTPPTVSASVKTGTYTAAQSIVLTCNDGAGSGCKAIYYTTNGTSPSTAATTYTSAIAIGAGVTTLKFLAVDNSGSVSLVGTETYTVNITAPDTTPPTVSASVKTGTYTAAQSIVLSCNDGTGSGCKAIYYTTDGSTPTTASTNYTSAIAIGNGTTTLKFIAMDNANNASAVATEMYTVNIPVPDTTPPSVSASVMTGTYTVAQNVVLTCDDGTGSGCKAIYYTTDGSAPTTSSATYSVALTIGAGVTTLKFVAVDNANNISAVATETYAVNPVTTNKSGAFAIDRIAFSQQSVVIDQAGAIHVAYVVRTSTTTVEYGNCSADCGLSTSWSFAVVDTGSFGAVQLAVGSNGLVHLVYESGSTFVYATCAAQCATATNWSKNLISALNNYRFLAVVEGALAVDTAGRVSLLVGDANVMALATCGGMCGDSNNWSAGKIFDRWAKASLTVSGTRLHMAINIVIAGPSDPDANGLVVYQTCDADCYKSASWQASAPLFEYGTQASSYDQRQLFLAANATDGVRLLYNQGITSATSPAALKANDNKMLYWSCDANCMSANSWRSVVLASERPTGFSVLGNSAAIVTSSLDVNAFACTTNCTDSAAWSVAVVSTTDVLNNTVDPYLLVGCSDGSGQYIRPWFASFYPDIPRVALGNRNNGVVIHGSHMLRECSAAQSTATRLGGIGRIIYVE